METPSNWYMKPVNDTASGLIVALMIIAVFWMIAYPFIQMELVRRLNLRADRRRRSRISSSTMRVRPPS